MLELLITSFNSFFTELNEKLISTNLFYYHLLNLPNKFDFKEKEFC